MTIKLVCLILPPVYGILCAVIYLWLAPGRRAMTWRNAMKSTLWFTVIGALLSGIFYIVMR